MTKPESESPPVLLDQETPWAHYREYLRRLHPDYSERVIEKIIKELKQVPFAAELLEEADKVDEQIRSNHPNHTPWYQREPHKRR